MVCPTDEVARDVRDCFKRLAAVLSSVDTFQDVLSNLPDDREDEWLELASPAFLRFMQTFVALYPNGPGQFQADIKAIGDIGTVVF